MYIYKTTNLITGKIYIGQSTMSMSIDDSKYYLGSGTILLNSIKKCGRENFTKEILKQDIQSQELLDKWGEIFIIKFKSTDKNIGYNLLKGGDQKHPMFIEEIRIQVSNKLKGVKKTDQHRQNMSRGMKGENHPLYGKRWKIDKSTNKAVFL
jgi:group I intron endonuclease